MNARFIFVLIPVAAAFVGGYLLNDTASPAPEGGAAAAVAVEAPAPLGDNPFNDNGGAEFDLLRRMLQGEIEARQRLEKTVAMLNRQVATLAAVTPTASPPPAEAPADPSPSDAAFDIPQVPDTRQALISAGLDETSADRIQHRFEQTELDKLYLRNRAMREGWMESERYEKELSTLDSRTDIYRSELGDDAYDRFLYLSGRNNRVVVSSVISDSPAADAGIGTGDIILGYDNKRIFDWTDLSTATSKGQEGQSVRVTVERDGVPMDVYVPRGPLGVRLGSSRVEP